MSERRALIVPWAWRNWRLTSQLLPIHANGGYNFYLGNDFARLLATVVLYLIGLAVYGLWPEPRRSQHPQTHSLHG